jgi:thioredoxin reductase (NADPH)
MKVIKIDLAIIGGGVAGFSAAMYAGRLGLKSHIFGSKMGGTIALASTVENYPGFKSISGMDLSNKLKEHAMVFNPEIINKEIVKIKKHEKGFHVYTKKEAYHAKGIILATGTEWKKLEIPGEKELTGKGVHYCALCDGFFYKGKTVAVIGGADSAIKEAIYLASLAKKVYIIYRKEQIHPEPIILKQMNKLKNIKIIKNTNLKKIIGKNKLEKIKLDNPYNDSDELILDGIFIDIGHIPMVGLAKGVGLKLNKKNEIITNKSTQTNIPGIFAAGDVTDTPFKQAIIAASEGSTAAFSAYQYISKGPIKKDYGKSKAIIRKNMKGGK